MRKRYKKVGEYKKSFSQTMTVKEQLLTLLQEENNNLELKNLGDVIVYIGDVNKCLKLLPDNSIDCVVTSPPYWKQRDYKDPRQIGQEDTYEEYIKNLLCVFNELKRVLKSTGTFFLNIGYKYQEKELLLIPELLALELQKNGWALLNKIIWYKPNAMPSSLDNRFSNVYEPVFLFVKKESKYKYYFSIDNLRLPTKNFMNNKKPEDILGLEVKDSLVKNKMAVKGYICKIFKNSENNILALIEWEDGRSTIEIVQDFDKESQIPVELFCPDCGRIIKTEIDIDTHQNCKRFPKPILPPEVNFDNKEEIKSSLLLTSVFSCRKEKVYKGKFKLSPENRGASPGARKSLFGEYLVLQRRYKIFQPIIADYLRFWKDKRNISIKEIDALLGYEDTASHWFRKDTGRWGKGGSIPLPDDWFKLKKILGFDDIYDRWVTETHLVLQTVKAHPKGKNPGDVWSIQLQPFPEAHFATFPEELVKRCIEAGCPEGGVVLDPFAGSGTTGKVAQEMGRKAILIELVPIYIDIIKKRCKDVKEVVYVK